MEVQVLSWAPSFPLAAKNPSPRCNREQSMVLSTRALISSAPPLAAPIEVPA